MTTDQSSANIFDDIPCLRPHAARINQQLSSKRPEASVRAHRERFEGFAEWAQEVERQAELDGHPRTVLQMPVKPWDLAAYTMWMDEDGLALSTISSYVSSIGALHLAAGFLNPTASEEVKGALAKLRAKHADDELQRARALSDAEIEDILSVLRTPRRTRGRRRERPEEARKRADVDKAMLLSMIQAGMRRTEAADLTWASVQQEGDGSGIILLPVDWRGSHYRGVRVTEECAEALMAIKPEGAPRSSKVFDLSGSQINRRLKRMCEEAGIDSTDISGYTPRATLQRLMVEKKAPVEAIKVQLRLKAPAAMEVFIHTEDDDKDVDWLKQEKILPDLDVFIAYVETKEQDSVD